jgi:hypothetical protein
MSLYLCDQKTNMSRKEYHDQMLAMVEAWRQSGMTQKQFTGQHNISLSKFLYWVKKSKESYQNGFVQLNPTSGSGIIVRYPSGIELMLPNETPLQVLKALVNS